MDKVLHYLKYIGIFMIFILISTLFISLFNVVGFKFSLVSKLSLIFTMISFFTVSVLASHNTNNKGYIEGLILGVINVLLFIIINLIFFRSSFNLNRIIYYIILIISSILGGSMGKNFSLKKLAR